MARPTHCQVRIWPAWKRRPLPPMQARQPLGSPIQRTARSLRGTGTHQLYRFRHAAVQQVHPYIAHAYPHPTAPSLTTSSPPGRGRFSTTSLPTASEARSTCWLRNSWNSCAPTRRYRYASPYLAPIYPPIYPPISPTIKIVLPYVSGDRRPLSSSLFSTLSNP